MKFPRFFLRAAVMITTLTLLVSALIVAAQAVDLGGELLVYRLFNQPPVVGGGAPITHSPLMIYDLERGLSAPLLANTADGIEDGVGSFSFGGERRLAFATLDGQSLFALDIHTPSAAPTLITQMLDHTLTPLAWSGDGRYLAFVAAAPQGSTRYALYVWDGVQTIPVTDDQIQTHACQYDVAWSSDGRLAFTVRHCRPSLPLREVYLWDGSSTSNVSQNPDDDDQRAAWSSDGRLAFRSKSKSENEERLFVWDGVSMRDGQPDKSTFIRVAPDLDVTSTIPVWTNNNQLVFRATPIDSLDGQLYLWDGQSVTNITEPFEVAPNDPDWAADGYWAFTNSGLLRILVIDPQGQHIITFEPAIFPTWSANGGLFFCQFVRTEAKWTVMLWDRDSVTEIARDTWVEAQLQNGTDVSCGVPYQEPIP